MELFNLLDIKGNPTGVTSAKGTQLNNVQYYFGTHTYIYNLSLKFLIQQRAYSKTFLPGGWNVHLEHIIAGETSVDCVCRGMQEEVGLLLDSVNISYPNKFIRHEYIHIVDVYFIQTKL